MIFSSTEAEVDNNESAILTSHYLQEVREDIEETFEKRYSHLYIGFLHFPSIKWKIKRRLSEFKLQKASRSIRLRLYWKQEESLA